MIEGVASTKLGATDLGSDREHPRPCLKRTWCCDADGHAAACVEAPRAQHAKADFGPGVASKASGFAQAASNAESGTPAPGSRTGHATASGAAPVPAEANAGGAGASNEGGAPDGDRRAR